jgi:hypothetical protein
MNNWIEGPASCVKQKAESYSEHEDFQEATRCICKIGFVVGLLGPQVIACDETMKHFFLS